MNVGAPSPGINATVFSFVRHALATRCRIHSIRNGFEGLVTDAVEELDWKSVYGKSIIFFFISIIYICIYSFVLGWTTLGGSMLGTQRVDAKQVGYEKIANKLTKYKIDGLLIIGGIILKG